MNISSFDIKEKFKSVKNVVMQVTPVEAKVRACTSNDPWGAKSTDKSEVAEATYNLYIFLFFISNNSTVKIIK